MQGDGGEEEAHSAQVENECKESMPTEKAGVGHCMCTMQAVRSCQASMRALSHTPTHLVQHPCHSAALCPGLEPILALLRDDLQDSNSRSHTCLNFACFPNPPATSTVCV
jgi:hypothetical protein